MAAITARFLPIAKAQSADELLEYRDFAFQFWRGIFLQAGTLKASDIHVEPYDDWVVIRLRVNGILRDINKFFEVKELRRDALNKLKTLCRLDLSHQDTAQDSAFTLALTNCRYRVALCPTEFGESFVFRVIYDDKLPSLSESNLPAAAVKALQSCLAKEQGIVLMTGPTGSGKSTTLQAALLAIDRKARKVITIEDPVERILPDIQQTQITKSLSWAKAISSAMRRDPDIILIGEIRDRESAALAIEAANTGHLVISTIHANNVVSTFDRLTGLGIERELLAENILMISAQRLLKKICQDCRAIDEASSGYHQGPGCVSCLMTGVVGRVPILEYTVEPDPQSIVAFDKSHFQRTQLKTSLSQECQRLVNIGLVDSSYLNHWRNS